MPRGFHDIEDWSNCADSLDLVFKLVISHFRYHNKIIDLGQSSSVLKIFDQANLWVNSLAKFKCRSINELSVDLIKQITKPIKYN